MSTETETPDVAPSVRRWVLFNWKNARRILIALALVITLIAVFFTFENWRGRRAWQAFVAEMKAAGEPLELKELLPPMPADDQNFAQIPLLKPLLNYGKGTNGQIVWEDAETKTRLETLHFAPKIPGKAWSDRHSGRETDFALWQTHLRDDTNFHFPVGQVSASLIDKEEGVEGAADVGRLHRYDTNHAVADVVLALKKYDVDFAALHGAVERPYIQFPVHYEEGFATLLTHLQVLRNFGKIARLKAVAALAQNRAGDAWKEFELIVRMSEAADSEPVLISQLVRIAMLNEAMEIAWEGMAKRRWSVEHLRSIEERLRGVDQVKAYVFSMRGERLLALRGLDLIRNRPDALGDFEELEQGMGLFRNVPFGWYQNNLVELGRAFEEYALPYADLAQRRFHVVEARRKGIEFDEELKVFSINRMFVNLLFPAYRKVLDRCAECQVSVDELRVACAVELFRLENKSLPKELDEVAPMLGVPLPKDPTTGEDYRFRLEADTGAYLIYSPGGDGVDDGGVSVAKDKGKGNSRNEFGADLGDWVWRGI